MFKKFYPCAYVDSVFSIDYKKLYDKGYRGLIFDIDNTLVHHGDDTNPDTDALFEKIRSFGLSVIFLSNNSFERIHSFNRNIKAQFISEADKPSAEGYNKAVTMLGISKNEALCIGDQVFTDILGANKAGIDSILVRYLVKDKNARIGIKRRLEKIILMFYKMNKKCFNKLGNICTSEDSDINALE